MSALLSDILNVLIRKVETEVEISVDIISYNSEQNFLYLKSYNDMYNSEFLPKDKIELKLVRYDGIYYFDSTVIKIDDISGQICINSPKKCKKMNRRRASRHKFETEIKIRSSRGDKYGISFDLSEGGLGFYSKEFFYTGDILFIDFYSDAERKKYHVEVTVRDLFIGDDGYVKYGVEFADWVEDEFKQLTKYLKKKEEHRLNISKNEEENKDSKSGVKGAFFNKFIFAKK